jgi:protein TonB
MDYKFLLLFIFLTNLCSGQKVGDSKYFPQEQIVHPACANATDKNDCFYRIINNKVTEIVNANVQKIKTKKDTLKVNIELTVDNNGIIHHNINRFKSRNIELGKKAIKSILAFVDKLPKTKVYNRKPVNFISKHLFNNAFVLDRSTQKPSFKSIVVNQKYEGGVIQEIPVFPGCEGLFNKDSKTCFQTKMQKHIKNNFRYPNAAFKKSISGKVYVIMTINIEGDIKNIRTRGPSPILEEEARRIMSLLPKMKPGLENGKPVRIPHSIPITFSLSKPF